MAFFSELPLNNIFGLHGIPLSTLEFSDPADAPMTFRIETVSVIHATSNLTNNCHANVLSVSTMDPPF
jgi:hypothetical protein